MSERPIEELRAGDAFRQSVIGRADSSVFSVAPLWHGWVIMEAFLAGIDWARAQQQTQSTSGDAEGVDGARGEAGKETGGGPST